MEIIKNVSWIKLVFLFFLLFGKAAADPGDIKPDEGIDVPERMTESFIEDIKIA